MPNKPANPDDSINRRKFIHHTAGAAGAALLFSAPLVSHAANFLDAEPITVGQIMDKFISQIPNAPFPNTVDTLKAGNRDIQVTGVVTTMFATIELIKKAIDLNANFIIAHEPTFYNHADNTQWLEHDEVYRYKTDLLRKHNIAIWRNHDYIHSLAADGVVKGAVDQLGWQKFSTSSQYIYNLPPTTLANIIAHAKKSLNIQMVRYIGNTQQVCKSAIYMPGSAGGQRQIEAISKYQPDVALCGELSEWETAEYIRDARATGKTTALVVLGHIASEEPGSAFMAQWLKQHIPEVKVTHIPTGNSLSFM
ncbi:twin-arginine translocation signal domain-containing protein [Mucilaginibacter robiniae]|uniref:Twin-arginine translocation signal domain-containing protein n=1 Tax=Mucilaginibacter robiniae TaxID=2728022 RepID=A0A7L5DZQ7_9SPHI|nr:Nif3-like dinuclear metal center hexameric protein [Mucilaginibacter robiniae]QJD95587.1 twin-arginine translocation signal domain-containing protein [Mucilaginibacter robiniae]